MHCEELPSQSRPAQGHSSAARLVKSCTRSWHSTLHPWPSGLPRVLGVGVESPPWAWPRRTRSRLGGMATSGQQESHAGWSFSFPLVAEVCPEPQEEWVPFGTLPLGNQPPPWGCRVGPTVLPTALPQHGGGTQELHR